MERVDTTDPRQAGTPAPDQRCDCCDRRVPLFRHWVAAENTLPGQVPLVIQASGMTADVASKGPTLWLCARCQIFSRHPRTNSLDERLLIPAPDRQPDFVPESD